MGIFKRIFSGKRGREGDPINVQGAIGAESTDVASGSDGDRQAARTHSAGQRSAAKPVSASTPSGQAPAPTPEPTQEELFEIARKSYDFGGKAGVDAIPSINDIDILRKLEYDARHPRVQLVAKKRKEELLAEKRAQAKRQVAQLTSEEEIAALAENEGADVYLRRAAAKAVADQAVLKRWAMEQDSRSFLCMPERVVDPSDVIDIARDAKDPETRSKATEMIEDVAVLRDMALNRWGDSARALERLGGYGCISCHAIVLPEGDAPVACLCPACGAENHDWEHVSEVTDYRDYSAGFRWDECRRCHDKKNMESVYTGGM